jgi:hypothetical protein
MDLILCAARDVSQGEDAATGLANALATGDLAPSTFTAALDRVGALRAGPPVGGLHRPPIAVGPVTAAAPGQAQVSGYR